jgi:hypothetical protein
VRFSDDLLRLLVETSGATLDHVELVGCSSVSDVGLHAVANCCPQLRTLRLPGCTAVTDAGLTLIAERCLELCDVDLSCTEVGDSAVQAICERSTHLKRLGLRGCPRVGGGAVDAASCVATLEELWVGSVTDL